MTFPSSAAGGPPTGPIPPIRPVGRRRLVGSVAALLGIVVTVVGSFLPWLLSGSVRRNSYAVAGLVDRLLLEPGSFGAVLIGAWPFLGPLLMLSVVLAAVRWWRTAAGVALLGAVLAGAVAGATVAIGPQDGLVAVSPVGPTVVLVGAVLTALGAAVVLSAGRRG